MKKSVKGSKLFLSILLISVFIFSLQFVSAQTISEDIVEFVTSSIDVIKNTGEPIFIALLGDVEDGGDLFAKVLLFALVMLVVVAALEQIEIFSSNDWIKYSIGIIISIIGIRFLPNDMIEAMTLPSSALVAAISIGLPFIIYAYVLQKTLVRRPNLRRSAWVLFATVILVLWSYNPNSNEYYWIYPLFLLMCFFAFWFDGKLNKWFNRARASRVLEESRTDELGDLKAQIKAAQEELRRASNDDERNDAKEKIKNLRDNLRDLT
jgi:HAMP domain-containing protein